MTQLSEELGYSTKLERTKSSLDYARKLLARTIESGAEIPVYLVHTKALQLQVKRLSKGIRSQLRAPKEVVSIKVPTEANGGKP